MIGIDYSNGATNWDGLEQAKMTGDKK